MDDDQTTQHAQGLLPNANGTGCGTVQVLDTIETKAKQGLAAIVDALPAFQSPQFTWPAITLLR